MRTLLAIALSSLVGAAGAADIDACLACHTPQAEAAVPLLDGQQPDYLVNQLTRFRDHVRSAFPMDALAQGLDDTRIQQLADAFAARPWFSYSGRTDSELIALGAQVARQLDCRDCHGETLRGEGAVPRLAGQRPDYLEGQILAFASTDRGHPGSLHAGRNYPFSANEAAALAMWLAALR